MDIALLFNQLQEFVAQNPAALRKDTTGFWGLPSSATTGINYYDLELGAKTLVPVITPLRNKIPRTSGKGGIQANWRGIVGINASNVGGAIADGLRNAFVQTTTRDFIAAYKQIGLEDYVTFGADLAAQGFDDLKALSVRNLLWAVMIQEEIYTLGGVGTQALVTVTPTPSLAAAAAGSGGLTSTHTYSVRCVALSLDGYMRSTVAGGLPGQITFTTADGTSGQTYNAGCCKVSAAATLAATSTGIINASVTTVAGAVAYAWYWADSSGLTAGGEVLGAITTVPYYSISALATGTQTLNTMPGYGGAVANAADFSQNSNSFDGILTMCALSSYQPNVTVLGSPTAPGPWTQMPTATISGTTGLYGVSTLTADNDGGIVEIDAMLKWFWDTYRLSPTAMYVSSQEQTNMGKKVLNSSSGDSNARFVFETKDGVISGGYILKSYTNKYTMSGNKDIPVFLHPNMPAGTILFFTDILPYPLSNVTNVLQYRVLRDYYQIEWPLRTRRYEYGVYLHSVLQNYFPPAFAVLSGIGNG
jgi:hypothetical protein